MSILEDEATDASSLERKRKCREKISEEVSTQNGPAWDVESVKNKIKYESNWGILTP